MIAASMGVLLMAGCVDDAKPSNDEGAQTTAPPVEVSADTGSVVGTVIDDEAKPVVHADVAVTGPQQATTRTDAEGRFTINGLTPGSYTLTSLKLGYESAAKKIDVAAGAATEATLTLRTLVVDTGPRIDYEIRDGYIAGPNIYSAAVIYYSTPNFALNITRGAQEVFASMQWQQNTPTTAKYMRVGVTADGETDWAIGVSPLTANISALEITKEKDKATVSYSLYFMCSGANLTPQCFVSNPEALVPVIVYQQRVKLYTTVFYNQAAPEGYTGLP